MPDAPSHLLIRVDAGTHIGTGHVMRCLALAQGWSRSKGPVTFAMVAVPAPLRGRLEAEGFSVCVLPVVAAGREDARATLGLAKTLHARWVVADGYGFTTDWQETIRSGGLHLALLDDCGHAERYCADLILNQNVSANPKWYAKRNHDSHLALGLGHVLLRREFLERGAVNRTFATTASKVLVTLGGSDPDNVASQVIQELRRIRGIEAILVIGAANPHLKEIEALVVEVNNTQTWLRLAIDTKEMPSLMEWADAAVIAGGSTLWETAFMGLPSLVLIIAANQVPATQALATDGIITLLDSPSALASELLSLLPDASRRARMSSAARQLVDGLGVERVIRQMEAA